MAQKNELVKYARAEIAPRRQDREIARAAREVHNEVDIARLEVDGAMVVAEHLMDRVTKLNALRTLLAGDDPVLQMEMAEIFKTALMQGKAIQMSLFTGNW